VSFNLDKVVPLCNVMSGRHTSVESLLQTVGNAAGGVTESVSSVRAWRWECRTCMEVVTFPGVKWPERDADHSPPSSAEVKTAWNCPSTPPYALISWTGTIVISKGLWKEVIVS
jgi:hypothetical protein